MAIVYLGVLCVATYNTIFAINVYLVESEKGMTGKMKVIGISGLTQNQVIRRSQMK